MGASDLGIKRRALLRQARLYLVCDSRPGGRSLEQVLEAALTGGVQIVQLRDKHSEDVELIRLARSARELCERWGALFIVNDRPSVALALDADGVHIGQQDMPVDQVRELVRSEMLIGLSTHTSTEIDSVRESSADYIGVGPVHETPTKPGRAAVGLELVSYAAEHSPVPFFAIGGIDATNIETVLTAGARRVAVVRAIADAPEPQRVAGALRGALDGQPLESEAVFL